MLPIAALLTSCAPPARPLVQPKPIERFDAVAAFQGPAGAWPRSDWWTRYGDAELDTLVDEALRGSPDLAIATARFRQADAAAAAARGPLLPTVTAGGTAGGIKQSINQGIPDSFKSFLPHGWHDRGDAEADASWNFDLFGRDRASYAAANSESTAALIDVAAARLSIATAVATAYANLVQQVADREALRDTLRVRSDSAALVRARLGEQLENEGVVMQARALVSSAQADIDAVDGRIALARNEIAALLGQGPGRGLAIALPSRPALRPLGVPAAIPAELLGRRADIVAARFRIEAASHRIDAARDDFYPNISLTGQIGLQSIGLSDFLKAGSLIGQIGPAISLPIFDGGRRKATWRGTQAAYEEAVGQYDKVLLNALHEVADAIANERELAAELQHAQAAQQQSEGAYRIASMRYRAGLSRYTDALTAEDTLVQQRRAVADLQARSFLQDVALVSALGGGFDGDDAQTKPSSTGS